MKKITMSSGAKTEVELGGLFTGTKVWRQSSFNPEDFTNLNFGIVAFDAGSRNKFHKHSSDQILIITEGCRGVDVLELCVAVGMRRPFAALSHRLKAVTQFVQETAHRRGADLPALLRERRRQLRSAFACPPKG